MQIAGLSQCFSRWERVKMEINGGDLIVTISVTTDYKTCSKLAYLRPTLLLMDSTRVMRGTL